MLIFLTIIALFDKFYNIFFHFLEMAVLLNDFDNIHYSFMPIFDGVMMLLNAILYLFFKNV